MEKTGSFINYPTREVIVRYNRRVIEETTGFFVPPENLLNPLSLEWVLDAIQYPLSDVYLYPSLAEKAAILAWTIITKHVFFDGNKRTGMLILMTLLLMNGYELNVTTEEIIETALLVANCQEYNYKSSQFAEWVKGHMKSKPIL